MHARPRRGSWATLLWLSHARAKSECLTLPNWDQPAKGDSPDRKHWSSSIAGVGSGADNPILEKKVTKTEGATAGRWPVVAVRTCKPLVNALFLIVILRVTWFIGSYDMFLVLNRELLPLLYAVWRTWNYDTISMWGKGWVSGTRICPFDM
jgi:hypothetical protein